MVKVTSRKSQITKGLLLHKILYHFWISKKFFVMEYGITVYVSWLFLVSIITEIITFKLYLTFWFKNIDFWLLHKIKINFLCFLFKDKQRKTTMNSFWVYFFVFNGIFAVPVYHAFKRSIISNDLRKYPSLQIYRIIIDMVAEEGKKQDAEDFKNKMYRKYLAKNSSFFKDFLSTRYFWHMCY